MFSQTSARTGLGLACSWPVGSLSRRWRRTSPLTGVNCNSRSRSYALHADLRSYQGRQDDAPGEVSARSPQDLRRAERPRDHRICRTSSRPSQ